MFSLMMKMLKTLLMTMTMINDDERSAADYGMIGVLDCSVINCPLLFPQACLLEIEALSVVKM